MQGCAPVLSVAWHSAGQVACLPPPPHAHNAGAGGGGQVHMDTTYMHAWRHGGQAAPAHQRQRSTRHHAMLAPLHHLTRANDCTPQATLGLSPSTAKAPTS